MGQETIFTQEQRRHPPGRAAVQAAWEPPCSPVEIWREVTNPAMPGMRWAEIVSNREAEELEWGKGEGNLEREGGGMVSLA